MIYTDSLTPKSQKVFDILKELTLWKDFYLAGGTGLALQINHRSSVDFDFFSPNNELSREKRDSLCEMLKCKGDTVIIKAIDRTLEVMFKDVKMSFFSYNYPLVDSPVKSGRIRVSSITDIGLMKLASIIGRGSKKDFVDIYFIIRQYIKLEKMLEVSGKKFSEIRGFNNQALRALVYFEDAEQEEMPELLEKNNWKEIKAFITGEVKRITKRIFGLK